MQKNRNLVKKMSAIFERIALDDVQPCGLQEARNCLAASFKHHVSRYAIELANRDSSGFHKSVPSRGPLTAVHSSLKLNVT